jgi:hypothetical protein
MASRGDIIFSAGDPASVVEDLIPPTIETDVISELQKSTKTTTDIRFAATNF